VTDQNPTAPVASRSANGQVEVSRQELLEKISRLEFERDGYYGEWQNSKNRLARIKRSPAWPVWLAWVLFGKIVIWPIRKGFELIGAAGRVGLRFVGRVFLMVSTLTTRIRARRRQEPDSIPNPNPPAREASLRKPRVLIVMPYSIYPPHHGGAVRLFNLVKHLANRCELYLLIFTQDGEDPEQRKALEPYCARVDFHHWMPSITRDRFGLEPPSALLFNSTEARAKIIDIVVGFHIDVVQLEYTELGQYVSAVPRGVPVILTEHDIAFRSFDRRRKLGFHHRFPEGAAFGTSRADANRLQRYELRWNEEADQVHTMSVDDARVLARFMPDGAARLRVLPNGVDTDYYAPPEPAPARHDVLYVGNFENLPNVDALEYFVTDVWPMIRLRCPGVRLTVVGAKPSERVLRFEGSDGISVLGEVADLRPAYHQHRVMVAPIRAGSGTRLKILEACAAGLPVVTTTLGAEGIEYEDGRHLLTADGAVPFADAVVRVLTNDTLGDELSRAGMELVREHYDWRLVADRLWQCYEELLADLHPLMRGGDDGVLEILEPTPSAAEPPDVSILIPTLSGGDDLARCLDAIDNQQTERVIEVVCVDSGSPSEDLDLMERHGARIVRIDKKRFNHGLTRDLAARNSNGGLLVFLNQDAVPADQYWLGRITEPLWGGADNVAAVQGGILEVPEPDTRFYWESCGDRFYFTRETSRWMKTYGIGFSTVNCAMVREVWDRHPFGWAPIMEDKKWQREIVGIGYEIVDRPDAAVFHTHDYDLRSLIRRCRSEGFGWRSLGIDYSLWDAIRDMLKPGMYFTLMKGVLRGRVRTSAELLFPWVRPLNLWWGNHHVDDVSL
jgi:rhamnosyltransferase